jgi:putative ABC transport system ATP-binding protein
MLKLDKIGKVYRTTEVETQALNDVSLQIDAGEFVAVMGPSGCGKSTLLNILGLLDTPSAGTYEFFGENVSAYSEAQLTTVRRAAIGFVFQSFNLIARTSALENVELPLFYSDLPLAEQRSRAHAALQVVGLADREHHLPNQLSGGQQQRVAIARALVNQPPLILADEPTGNLDSRTSIEILEVFQDLNRSQGITVLLVTHEPDIATFARRVITFRDGHVISDVRQAPQDAHDKLAEAAPPSAP